MEVVSDNSNSHEAVIEIERLEDKDETVVQSTDVIANRRQTRQSNFRSSIKSSNVIGASLSFKGTCLARLVVNSLLFIMVS
jgi:hypothetical protein